MPDMTPTIPIIVSPVRPAAPGNSRHRREPSRSTGGDTEREREAEEDPRVASAKKLALGDPVLAD